MKRPIAALAAVSLLIEGCTGVQVTVLPRQRPSGKPVTVAVLPFENLTSYPGPIGAAAANLFSQRLITFPQYRVLGETTNERTVNVRGKVEEGKVGAVEVTTTEKGVDPIEWGRAHGADAVVTGSVTVYREKNMWVLPPARAGIDARLIDVKTRQVLWSASHTRGYGAMRWAVSIIWPVGILLALFSPAADERLKDAVDETASALESRLAQGR